MSTWIFLRGLTRESRHWGSFPDVFRALVPEAQVTALDLPGCGHFNGEESPARVQEIVERCREELGSLQVPGPYKLLALSLGAIVAVEWAARHPQEVSAAVLINTSLRPFSPWHHRLKPRNIVALLRLSFSGQSARAREALILRLTSNMASDQQATLDAWTSYWREQPVSRRNAFRQLLAAARYRAPAERPPIPLLLLASKSDGLVDYRCSQRIAKRWHVPLVIHPGAGHDLALDDGAWVGAQVQRWLSAMA